MMNLKTNTICLIKRKKKPAALLITILYFIACSAFSLGALSHTVDCVSVGCRYSVCMWEIMCKCVCGSWLYWLCVLPSRAWFNTAFVNVGQNSLRTALSPLLCLYRPLFLLLILTSWLLSVSVLLLSLCTSLSHFPMFRTLVLSFYPRSFSHFISLWLPIIHCLPPSPLYCFHQH